MNHVHWQFVINLSSIVHAFIISSYFKIQELIEHAVVHVVGVISALTAVNKQSLFISAAAAIHHWTCSSHQSLPSDCSRKWMTRF